VGGKTNTTTQQVQIPPEVLARYNSVNSQAQQAAAQPFQVYSTNPDAFVAPINSTEQAGILGTSAAANEAQPYFGAATSQLGAAQSATQPYFGAAESGITLAQNVGNGLAGVAQGAYTGAYTGAQPYNSAATGLALAGAQQVNPQNLNIGEYLSPYLSTVLGSESALLNQNNQQQQSGQLGNAISQGAFGGDRAGIAAANLEQQQNLANANIYSGILNTGFNTALGAAQQQQGVNLSAAQANRGALQTTAGELQGLGQQAYTQGMGLGSAEQGLGQQQFEQGLGTAQAQQGLGQAVYGTGAATSAALANLGSGAQNAALSGAQAQLSAGQVAQQTQQAGDTALYNQFLQQQSYPFQVDQFLANIAEGTGALSGTTTTTTQPGGFFSDERLKENIEPVGKTYDGQKIYRYNYRGDPRTRIGLIAQDVERRHPDAVGLAGGFRTVNYDKATDQAAQRGHFRLGGLAGAEPTEQRLALAGGGGLGGADIGDLLAAHEAMYGPYAQDGLYGGLAGSAPRGGTSYVPQATLPVGHLAVAGGLPSKPLTGLQQVNEIADLAGNLGKLANSKVGRSIGQAVGLGGGHSGLSDADGDDSTLNDISGDLASGYQRGGHVWRGGASARMGLASGGAPYDGRLAPEFRDRERWGQRPGIVYARQGLAAGGEATPYDDGGFGLAIPDDQPQGLSLALPGTPPPKPKSGLGELANIASDVAKIAPYVVTMARGGTAGSAGAEVPDDPAADDERASLTALARRIVSSNDNTGADAAQQPLGIGPGVSDAPTPATTTQGSGLGAAQMPVAAQAASGLPSDLNAIMASISKIEGTGKNPKSTAHGPFQIVDPTFVQLFREMFPDRAAEMSKSQILAVRNTPEGDQISGEMGPYYAQQNMGYLAAAGIEPNAPNVYLAHFLGPSGAIRLLSADPSAPAASVTSPLAVKENLRILGPGKTVGDVVNWAANQLASASRAAFRAGGAVRRGFDVGGAPVDTSADDDAPEPGASDLAAAAAAPDPAPTSAAAPSSTAAPASTSAPATASGDRHKGFLGSLTDPKVFIPILTGLAAMGTAPTQHFGVALAAGLGAGAQSYQQQRQYQLQQAQLGQKGQEIGYYGQATQAQLLEARARMLEAGTQGFNLAMQAFQNRFTQVPQLGPDGLPMWRDMLGGRMISSTDRARQQQAFYENALRRFGVGQIGPIGAIGDFGGPDAQASRLPGDNPGSGAAGGDNLHGPVLGPAVAGAGGVESGPGGNPAGGLGVGGGPGPSLLRPGPRNAPPQRLVVPDNWPVAKKVAAGAYRNPPLQLPPVDKSQIDPSDDPDQLEARGYALWNAGEQDAGKTLLDRATQIRDGQIPAEGATGQPYYGYAQQHQALEAQNAVVQGQAAQKNTMRTEALQFTNEYSQTKQALNALAKIYTTQDPERQAPAIADFIGTAASIPGVRSLIPDNWRDVLAGTDEGAKEAMVLSIERAVDSNLLKAPAKALSVTAKAVPGPGLSADARFDLHAQMMALLQQRKDFYAAWERGQDNIDKTDQFATDWVNAHPITAYESAYADRLPFFAGMSKAAMARLNGGPPRSVKSMDEARQLRSGVPVKIPPGYAGAGQIVLAP